MGKKILIITLLTLSLFLISACNQDTESSNHDKEEAAELVIADWGSSETEVRNKEVIEPFQEQSNIDVLIETPVSYGKLKAMVDSGNVTWDVVVVDTFWAHQAAEQGLLEPLDYDIISKDGVIPELVNEYSIGAEMYTILIAYSTEQFSTENSPESWADFWDVESFPGPRGLYKGPEETLELALLADGVSSDDLYPLDVDRAFKSLDKLRESTEIVWWENGAQQPELLSTGSVVTLEGWNGRIIEAMEEGAPIDLNYNQGVRTSVSYVVPKGSKNKEAAMGFIDYATSAEAQANFVNAIDYQPINVNALEKLTEERREALGQTEELIDSQILRNEEEWAQNYDELYERFQEWLID